MSSTATPPPGGDGRQRRAQPAHHDRGEPQRHLVHDKDARTADHRLAERQHLLLSPGQRPGHRLLQHRQLAEQVEHHLNGPGAFGAREHQGGGAQVVGHCEVLQHPVAFRDGGQPCAAHAVGVAAGQVVAVQLHRPGIGGQDPGHGQHEGGLARPVGPQQRRDGARRNGQVNPVNHLATAARDRETGHDQAVAHDTSSTSAVPR